ncbi:iron ABC transporter permease [Acidaminobacter sp. JC074]|uniref:ABC transporter permease n=1 Tax=Acidaminobacter sp. JC074 TaxID=2530199 RepID=UPI001F0DEDC6|nr:iron ABC transporter permease [Acidaminobacter sp. JC074]MCH4887281.1 iron ABC transporter permease [Acidaminobacter sp. JC074]
MKTLKGHGPLFLISTIIVLLILLPTFTLIGELFSPIGENWHHIKEFLLKEYILNTLILVLMTGLITGVIGTYLSWMLSHYDFKHNKLLYIILFLPMAIPPYIAGYVYGGIFNYGGTLERLFMKWELAPIRLDILSIPGAIFVFSIFLMPYVILVTKSFFQRLPASYFESSSLLGKSASQTFMKIILPLSRGAIIGGVVLVMLEVLNDYGLVKYFGIPTFSTAIYTTWFGLGDVSSAIRLASILMVLVIVILSSEHALRGRKRISLARANAKSYIRKKPSKLSKHIFFLIYILYVLAGLIIPLMQLTSWAMMALDTVNVEGLIETFKDTVLMASIVTVLVLVCGLIIGNFNRLVKTKISKAYARVVVIGYSIPASIIAVAVMIFFISFDRNLGWLYDLLSLKSNFLMGSLIMLIFALTLRFMAIGFNSIESGFNKMGNKYYEASILLGKSGLQTFFKVDFPLLKPALLSAMILTFVDVLKELPLTLILRPFNYDTLATKVFVYAGDEMIHEASVYALMIIGLSATALIIMQYILKERRNAEN